MKEKKRFLLIAPLLLLMVTCLLCYPNNLLAEEAFEVNYVRNEKREQFLVGSWVSFYPESVKSYEEQVLEMGENGLNFLIFPTADWGNFPKEKEGWQEIDELMTRAGIVYGVERYSSENLDTVEGTVALAEGLENAQFYHLRDEPGVTELPFYGELLRAFLEADNTRAPFLNLFPSYVGTAAMGGDYEHYVSTWVNEAGPENLEYLSHDHYPFGAQGDSASYFSDLEVMRKVAYENGKIKTHGFPQSGSWNSTRRPTKEELRWNIYTYLAYGFKALSWFNWVAPAYVPPSEGGEGMQDFIYSAAGEPTDLLEPAVELNYEMRALGPSLMQLDAAHVYHTAGEVGGVEYLPKNWIIQPTDSSADLLISYMEGKGDFADHLMIVNKSYEKSQNVSFYVSDRAGIESLELCSAETGEYEPLEIREGMISFTLDPGDGRLIKMNGDIVIPEALKAPQASLASGSYVGMQEVALTADEDAEIFYTLDGSYPTVDSARYEGPLVLGAEDSFAKITLRAIAVRGEEISEVLDLDYLILRDRGNVAFGKSVTLSAPFEGYRCYETPTTVWLTDGVSDYRQTIATARDSYGTATVDLGKNFEIDTVKLDIYKNDRIDALRVEVAQEADFSDGVKVFELGEQNYTVEEGRIVVTFEPRTARFVRVYSESDFRSIYTEIEVYNTFDYDTDLSAGQDQDWTASGAGQWELQDGVFSQSAPYDPSEHEWLGSYVYTGQTYTGLMAEAVIRMTQPTSGNYGFVGFELWKSGPDQSGVIVGIRQNGTVLIWHDYAEYLLKENVLQGFDATQPFLFKVTAADNMITVSVNGISVLAAVQDDFAVGEGYFALFSGVVPASFSEVKIQGFAADHLQKERIISGYNLDFILPVELFTEQDYIQRRLPETVEFYDNEGNIIPLAVDWDFSAYDRKKVGFNNIYGVIRELPEGVKNLYDISAQARVFVKYQLDKSELSALVAQAEALNPADFTPESWKAVENDLIMAKGNLTDDYARQSDLGVGIMRLYGAMQALVRVTPLELDELQAQIDRADRLDWTKYAGSEISAILELREECAGMLEDHLLSQKEIDDAAAGLKAALDGLTPLCDLSLVEASLAELRALDTAGWSELKRAELEELIRTAELMIGCGTESQTLADALLDYMQSFLEKN